MSRIVKVARTQMLNRNTFIGVPLIVLGGAFVMSLLIFAIIPTDEYKYAGGAAFAPIWYYIGAGVYGLTLTFPFSQAMSVTRREFFLGAVASAVLSGVGLAIIFVVLGFIEQATGGWWMNGGFFRVPGFWEAGPLISGLLLVMLVVLMFVTGFIFATVYRRWGVLPMVSILVGLALLLVGALFVIGKLDAWEQAFSSLMSVTPLGWIGIGSVLALVLCVLAERLLRRTVV